MGRQGLKASQKGIEKANIALTKYALNQNDLAENLEMSRQTVNNFFKRKPISRENFRTICDRLDLNLEETVEFGSAGASSNNQIEQSELDALVQDVRQKVHANIKKRCGEMRVLDMSRPIDLDTIYTDVNILQEITGRRRLDLAELLKHCSLEEFDRLGFAHAKTERRSGLEAVEEFDHLMLLGKPGAGKTTFLKRLATLCNAGKFQGHRVPIFITLQEFGDSDPKPNLIQYIRQWLQDLGVQDPQQAEQILNQGRGFLLLDGLDEVSENVSKQVIQEIQSFANRFSQSAFVVSCRIAAREFTFQQFTEVEVADFNDEQIASFASRWFQAKQLAEKTEKFLEKLEGHYRIKELATNPLLLTLLCLVFEGRTDFPANRSELYKEGLDVLLKKWDGARSIEREQVYRELSLKRKEDLLSQLAYTTFEPGNYFFKQKDTERLIEAYIQNLPGAKSDPEALRLDSEAVLKSIEAQHGLLVERARGIYSFSHLTFHEYFTARNLENRDGLHSDFITHLTEKRWREVFLLATETFRCADSLLLLMKSWIDQLLETDEKIQQFLTWVNQKSLSTNTSNKPVAIRAFYFDYDRDFNLSFDLGLNINLNRGKNHLLVRTLYRDRDLALAQNQEIASIYDLALVLAYAFARDYAINSTVSPALRQYLEELRKQLPDLQQDWNHFKVWWTLEGLAWIENLRTAMIEHRNIGHDWQFSDAQKQLLQQYYDANKLLVNCLNSDCYVSREVRQEIEESLLLPLAEIKQQFPNQHQQKPC